jgi:plastocyanin
MDGQKRLFSNEARRRGIILGIASVCLLCIWFSIGAIPSHMIREDGNPGAPGMRPTRVQSSVFDNELWWRTWGTTANEMGTSIWGNGTAFYTVSNLYEYYQLVKWNANGNQVWNKSFFSDNARTSSVWSDGTYVYTIGEARNPYGTINTCLYKWNANGVEQWHKYFNNNTYNQGYGITGIGNEVYTAGSTDAGSGLMDMLLIKWNSDGSIAWNRTWRGNGKSEGLAVWTNGSNVYVTGRTNIDTGNDAAIVTWDTNGAFQWSRTYITPGIEFFNSIWGTGNIFYTCGYTSSNNDLAVQKWGTSGNSVWNRTWGGSTSSSSGYGVMGDGTNIYTIGSVSGNLMLVKWDPNGIEIWNQTWGGSGTENGRAVWCNATAIYACGSTASYGAGGSDLLLIKCDTDRKPIADLRLVNPYAYEDQATPFVYNGTDGDSITDYQWYFGDGTGNATGKSPSHTFTNPGVYDVVCTVVDADSDRNTKHRSVNITTDQTPAPDFAASTTIITTGGLVSFTRLGSIGDSPATFAWSFGDGTANSTQEGPQHVYTTPGTYTVILSVTDVDGDLVTVTKAGYIRVDAPTAPGVPGFVPVLLLIGAVVALAGLTKSLAKKTCNNRE